MPSLILRDWALASAQLLNPALGGPPVYPYQPDGIWESLAITKERDFTYPASSGSDLYRRSLYTFWRRTVAPANLFDTSNRQACRVRSQPTSTPLHALTTLNDPTWVESARVLAEHAWLAADSDHGRLSNAFLRVCCRPPGAAEIATLLAGLNRQRQIYAANPDDATQLLIVGQSPRNPAIPAEEHAAWTAICLAILNLDQSLTRE